MFFIYKIQFLTCFFFKFTLERKEEADEIQGGPWQRILDKLAYANFNQCFECFHVAMYESEVLNSSKIVASFLLFHIMFASEVKDYIFFTRIFLQYNGPIVFYLVYLDCYCIY